MTLQGQRLRTRWNISEWEFREAVRRVEAALKLPHGHRAEAMRRIAPDYEVSVRTLHRWRRYQVEEVKVGQYIALFAIGSGEPSQMTRWEMTA